MSWWNTACAYSIYAVRTNDYTSLRLVNYFYLTFAECRGGIRLAPIPPYNALNLMAVQKNETFLRLNDKLTQNL